MTSFLWWVSILKCTITVVWVLVILETLGSQRFSRILEETLDIISFMWVHWNTWQNSRGHHEIGVVLGNLFVQIPFPKYLFTPRTPHGHMRIRFWRFQIFPVSRLPSTFVRWYSDLSAPFFPPCVLVSLESRFEMFADDGLRVEFLLNTDSGYPRDVEVTLCTLANPEHSLRRDAWKGGKAGL